MPGIPERLLKDSLHRFTSIYTSKRKPLRSRSIPILLQLLHALLKSLFAKIFVPSRRRELEVTAKPCPVQSQQGPPVIPCDAQLPLRH